MSNLYTTSTASRKLDIPQNTLVSIERRGAVSPWQRDSIGRRLLTDSDLEEVRRYLESRRRTQGAVG
jgi:DNA-binding transcriptional MerR regulator